MTARGTDWGLAALVALLVASGVLTLFAGAGGESWVYASHDALGLVIVLLLAVKLRRVWSRVRNVGRWNLRVAAGLTAALVVAATIGAGLLWAAGITPALVGYSLLAWHEALGVLLGALVAAHMLVRAKRPRTRDFASRRQFLVSAGAGAASLLAWRLQRPVEAVFSLRGASRQFTGSYEAGSFTGKRVSVHFVDRQPPWPHRAVRVPPHGRRPGRAQAPVEAG